MEWQSYIAIGIVIATLAVFVVRFIRPRKKRDCGHGCDCGKKPR